MTKTLTEQWRDGKLKEGFYYIKGAFDDDIYISHLDYEIEEDKRLPVEEVLAPVPSYDENNEVLQKLHLATEMWAKWYSECCEKEKQLAIATKALKDCCNDMKYWAVLTHRNQRILGVIKQALKEMECVK